jgi:hypothetical protein
VAERPSHSWTCPSCGRRVPLRAEVCHCGATRARAEEVAAAAPPEPRPRAAAGRMRLPPMPADVKALAVGGLVVLVTGLFWLALGPSRPPSTPAVLGHVDAGPPPAKPSPPPRPPFKLPWWK